MDLSPGQKKIILDEILDKADLLVLVLSPDGIIKQINSKIIELAGSSPVGKSFEELLLDFQSSFSLDDIRQPDTVHLLNVTKKSGLPLTYYFRFIQNKHEIIAIGQQDSEEIDSMRYDLLTLNNDLNNLTRELHKKNAELAKLNAQQNQFFGMASHDLRHPLGVIAMYSNFLETEIAESLSPVHSEFLEHITKSSTLMENILNDFLDYSIFESGRLELHCKYLDYNELLTRILKYTKQVARQKGLSLRYSPAPHPIAVYLDEQKIEQVVNNLTSNAIKASQAGNEIRVELDCQDSFATVKVSDDGVGIEAEHLELIFEPFNTLHAQKNAGEKSSGLGLAIVNKIVTAHGGRVWAESKVGVGTTFSFSLPC